MEKQSENDAVLWNLFCSGNDEAYSLIYKKYAANLRSFGLQFVPNRQLVEDCIHDIFVQLFSERSHLKTIKNIRLYLFSALKNRLFNSLKEKTRYTSLPDDGKNLFITTGNREDSFIREEEDQKQKHTIHQIMNELPPRQREVVFYRFFEGMSLEEIAILMEMNYQSVQNLLQRSLKKIKELYN
jgi:RNA polymerase sigma factor (sigma-70 family)